jgi:uncharacterized protein YsxB (DUF464 family)
MTKVMFNIDSHNTIMFDCVNHAENYDVCTIVSTLCNVLVEAAARADCEPTIYNPGHVRIDITKAQDDTLEIFETVMAVMKQAAEQHPEFIKIY